MAQQLVSESGGASKATSHLTIAIGADLGGAILSSVADTNSRRIVECLLHEPKTTMAIAKEVRLPPSTLYRKISELKTCGLVLVDSFEINGDGRREARYALAFTEIVLRLKGREAELEVVPSERSIEKRRAAMFSDGDVVRPPPLPGSGRSGAYGIVGGYTGGEGVDRLGAETRDTSPRW